MMVYKRIIALCLILCCGALVGSGCVRWQEKAAVFYVYAMEPFSVEGYVQPVFGAKVMIEGEVSVTAYTDSHGKAVTHIPPGTYRVEASKAGYTSVSRVITLYTLDLGPVQYVFQLAPTGG